MADLSVVNTYANLILSNKSIKNLNAQSQNSASSVLTSCKNSYTEALSGANIKIVKEYAEKFKNMEPSKIADELQKQINGISSGEKTLSMFDAIPDEKLLDVYKSFSDKTDKENILLGFLLKNHEHKRSWRHCPLLMQMYEEYSISKDEIYARMQRVRNLIIKSGKEAIFINKDKYNSMPIRNLAYFDNSISNCLGYNEPFSKINDGSYELFESEY